MQLLKDDEIVALVTRENPIVSDLDAPKNWYSGNSPVQPASIDLHIGEIYLPEAPISKRGNVNNPIKGALEQCILKVGGTAMVATKEKVALPDNIAAFGFPPTDISSRGILMTNPGHIDPGYNGVLHFTVINMGSKDFALTVGHPVVTLLLVELSGFASAGYEGRAASRKRGPDVATQLDKLAEDFLSVDRRATSIAKKRVRNANMIAGLIGAGITAIGVLFAAYLNITFNADRGSLRQELIVAKEGMQKDIALLKEKLEFVEIKTKYDDIERRLENIEKKAAAGTELPAPIK